jgi:hypothetical protein
MDGGKGHWGDRQEKEPQEGIDKRKDHERG